MFTEIRPFRSIRIACRHAFFASCLGIVLALVAGSLRPAGCAWCGRYGKVGEVTSPTWTPTEADGEKVKSIALPGAKFQPGTKVPRLFKETVQGRLAESLTSDCFHMRLFNDPTPVEYVFSADLSQTGSADSDWRLVLNLYYDGEPREIVGTWTTSGYEDACRDRMFKNDDAVVKRLKPIENLLWDFERTPVKCKMDWRGVTELGAGQVWNVPLSEFTDRQGRQSKSFNRYVVKAEKGEIRNGTACADDPKAKAFPVGTGFSEIKYKAPEEKGVAQDTITVYNSCEIRSESKWPMSKTPKRDKIDEKTIKIYRGDYMVDVHVARTWNFDSGSYHYEGELTATISGGLRKTKESQYPMPMFEPIGMNATWSFKSKKVNLEPQRDCPTLQSEYSGAGSYALERPATMFLHYFKNLGIGGELAIKAGFTDTYQVALAGASGGELKAPGKIRNDGSDCKVYRNDTYTVSPFAIGLQCKMPSDKKLSGSTSWSSDADTSSIGCSDLTEKPFNVRPFKPEANGNKYHYTIQWNIVKTGD